MKRYILAVVIVAFFAVQGYAQENPVPAQMAEEDVVQSQDLSIYGEVKGVNPAATSLTVQYYDYDSDEEKTIEVIFDSNTKMENASVISDIKAGNWADVIYVVTDGKNVVKSIIIEREEDAPMEMPKAEGEPEEMAAQ